MDMRTIIGLDVSSKTATTSVAVDHQLKYNGKITLDAVGFNSLKAIIESYGQPEVVFEATGHYSRRLEKYLLDQKVQYHLLNPLVAKKRLDDGSRMRKDDVHDAQKLALTEFEKHPEPFQPIFSDPVYRELSDLSRYYDQETEDIKRERNRLHRIIQLVFPSVDEELQLDQSSALRVLRKFPHPETLRDMSLDEIVQEILALNLKGIGKIRAKALATHLWRARNRAYPAVDAGSLVVKQLQTRIDNILRLSAERDEIISDMVGLARELPEYEILRSIPAIRKNTAVRLIAELGDIRRFEKRSQINSFIGIDLVQIESGNYAAQRRITKHGNPHARKLLYWTVVNMVNSTAKPNHIRDYYIKRQETASRRKPLLVSCMDRLIKTILYLIKTNQLYSYELAGSM